MVAPVRGIRVAVTTSFVDDRGAKGYTFSLGDLNDLVIVPAAALRDGAVFVLLEGKALRRAVKTGATSTQGVRVEQGLVGGEDLITNPPPGLKDGDKVRQKAATL